jgi:hypothetical protein
MVRRFRIPDPARRVAWFAALAAMAGAGVVSAQPAAPPQPPSAQTAPSAPGAPAPAAEEAPPVVVPTPQPIVVPPITEKEVGPAPAPQQPAAQPKATETPQRRPRYDVAVLQALDKVTAKTLRFEARVGQPVRYKTLIFTVRACERTAPDEPTEDSIAYLEILSQPRSEPGRPALPAKEAFKGWMYASSPSLNPLEHPLYDAWLITCRTDAPPPAAPSAAAPPPPAG